MDSEARPQDKEGTMGGTRTSPTLSQASQLFHLSKSSPFLHTANAREMLSPGAIPPSPKKLPIRRKEAGSDTSNSTSDSAVRPR
ncbi:hypothetical protein ACN38_g12774 [Penicillium nordicum]|uniref:Uncharacterized protein n=1 Tax=Penicillium nordicum TaxID=229535 RepID=A0A0N0RXB8_9EURO|nr:hypothetical protein ACN38_g12774 [Penicillium nordicum]